MSLRRNIIASYASQIYVTVIGIVMVPVYIRHMGTEAYGLVGFYAMLQAWFQLLDMGLAPTLSRQTARFSGGVLDALTLRRLLRVLEAVFLAVGAVGALAMWVGADWLATNWLQAQSVPQNQVRLAIQLMAGIISLRWMAGLYRGAIGGFERQAWLGWLNSGVATARFVIVLAIFEWIGATPVHFFGWQLLVAAVETLILVGKTYALLPPRAKGDPAVGWHWSALHSVIGFSLSIAFTSSAWILVTQTDKLILSKLLPLTDYAHFTMAVLVAGGVQIVSGPISSALIPRLTRLNAQGRQDELVRLYRYSTQLVVALAISTALALAFFADKLMWAWTGSTEIAQAVAPALSLYALGNGLLAVSGFPAYIQYAKGDLRLHVIGNTLFVLLLIPALVILTLENGMIGAGQAWLGANLAYLLLWTPMVHRRFFSGLHLPWILRDVGTIMALSLAGIGAGSLALQFTNGLPHERISQTIYIGLATFIAIITACLGTDWCQAKIKAKMQRPKPL